MSRSNAFRERGFSLVELAVVLVVLGLVTLLLVRFLGTAAREQHEVASRTLLSRADDALLAYAMVNSRLPCPDTDGGGEEDCGSNQIGQLPYRTLGLPDANARFIRYGVLRRSGGNRNDDADLARRLDRYDPLQVQSGTESVVPLPLGSVNGLDLCWALRNAGNAPLDSGYLNVTRPDAPGQIQAHVAYALALPRGGDGFSGNQAGITPSFDSPRRPQGPDFHDRVLAVGLDQLWSRMGCGDNLATAGHAHFNAAASVVVMHTAMTDYKRQLAISVKLAEANVANGTAAILSSTSGTTGAAAGISDAVAETLLSTGAVAYKIALASVATAAAAAAMATAVAMEGFAVAALVGANAAYEDVVPIIEDSQELESSVLEHAKYADRVGLYAPPSPPPSSPQS